MKEIISSFIISGIAFLLFIIFVIIGFTKNRKKLFLISFLFLLISLILGIFGIIKATKKTLNKIAEISTPRNGNEIYESLLGKPKTNCVEILNYQDQTVPKIDYAIWLHFKSCPKELKRILNKKKFTFQKMSTKDINSDQPDGNKDWFKPEKLGDSILVFKYYDEKNNGQEIYSSKDSTEIYLKDIAD